MLSNVHLFQRRRVKSYLMISTLFSLFAFLRMHPGKRTCGPFWLFWWKMWNKFEMDSPLSFSSLLLLFCQGPEFSSGFLKRPLLYKTLDAWLWSLIRDPLNLTILFFAGSACSEHSDCHAQPGSEADQVVSRPTHLPVAGRITATRTTSGADASRNQQGQPCRWVPNTKNLN